MQNAQKLCGYTAKILCKNTIDKKVNRQIKQILGLIWRKFCAIFLLTFCCGCDIMEICAAPLIAAHQKWASIPTGSTLLRTSESTRSHCYPALMCMTFGECVPAIFYLISFTSVDFSYLSLPFYTLIIVPFGYLVKHFFIFLRGFAPPSPWIYTPTGFGPYLYTAQRSDRAVGSLCRFGLTRSTCDLTSSELPYLFLTLLY